MPIPRFDEFMLPVLRIAGSMDTLTAAGILDTVADRLQIPEPERGVLLPSGKQTVLYSRVIWSMTYLLNARLLERPARGHYRITDRGRTVLADPPAVITKSWLKEHCPGFGDFVAGSGINGPQPESNHVEDDARTPEEQIDVLFDQINTELAKELLGQIKQCPPAFFERLVIDVLLAMGYGGSRADAGQAVGRSGDGGIDGIINEDRLGLDSIYVQAKRWESTVGRPQVQNFAGSLEGARARKGVFITTSDFAQTAVDYVKSIEKRIILIDGPTLARLMIEHNVGVTPTETYQLKKVDSDYFEGVV